MRGDGIPPGLYGEEVLYLQGRKGKSFFHSQSGRTKLLSLFAGLTPKTGASRKKKVGRKKKKVCRWQKEDSTFHGPQDIERPDFWSWGKRGSL